MEFMYSGSKITLINRWCLPKVSTATLSKRPILSNTTVVQPKYITKVRIPGIVSPEFTQLKKMGIRKITQSRNHVYKI